MVSRSHRILIYEKIAADCAELMTCAGEINQRILDRHLPITPLDLAGMQATMQAAERELRDLEIEAANS